MQPLPLRRLAGSDSAVYAAATGNMISVVRRNGLPVLVSTHAANHYEVTLVQLSFDF
jgi:hypothetical protein